MIEKHKTHWHACSVEQALAELASSVTGLSDAEVARRLARYGPNRLTPPKPRSALARFLAQFDNLLI